MVNREQGGSLEVAVGSRTLSLQVLNLIRTNLSDTVHVPLTDSFVHVTTTDFLDKEAYTAPHGVTVDEER